MATALHARLAPVAPNSHRLLQSTPEGVRVKIADFGLSKLLEPGIDRMTTVCGTWAYSSPEIKVNRQPYTHKVDLWSLGVLAFVILSGYHPFVRVLHRLAVQGLAQRAIMHQTGQPPAPNPPPPAGP